MRTAAALMAWLACASWAAAQDTGPRPPLELYLYASPDPLTQRVLSTQSADKHGGVVSAVLVSPSKASDPARARVSYQGAGTPMEGLSLPTQAMPSAPSGCKPPPGLRDSLNAALSQSRPRKGAAAPAALKRSLGANQLLRAVEELERSRTLGPAKAWDAAHGPLSEAPPPKKRTN